MKNQSDTNFVNTIISEIKGMEEQTMIFIFITSAILFIIDMILLFNKINIPNFIRAYYFYTFMIAVIYYVNLNARRKRLAKEAQEKQQYLQTLHNDEIIKYLKLIKPALDELETIEQFVLQTFLFHKSNKITLSKNLTDAVEIVRSINLKLCTLGLNIDIITEQPILVVEIDKIYYDILELYFSEGLKK